MTKTIQCIVNGQQQTITVDTGQTLLEALRSNLGLTGVKRGCGDGNCGTCTILMNGFAVNSCLVLAVEAEGQEILTIEGLQRESIPSVTGNDTASQADIHRTQQSPLHPLQQAFIDEGAVQCGFCTPGMILSAKALLDHNPNPTEEQIKHAIAGNVCRCTGYDTILRAIKKASASYSCNSKEYPNYNKRGT